MGVSKLFGGRLKIIWRMRDEIFFLHLYVEQTGYYILMHSSGGSRNFEKGGGHFRKGDNPSK
jgi:hypothetical protein